MGYLVWLLGAGAAIIGLALGFRLGEAERETLQEKMAALEKGAREKEAACEQNEQVLETRIRAADEKVQELTERLRTAQTQDASARVKPAVTRKKKPRKSGQEPEPQRDES